MRRPTAECVRATPRRVFFEREGVEVESLPFSVSPSDIAAELFQPEDWGETNLENVRLVSPTGRRMNLDIRAEGRLKRELVVQPPRWWLVRDELYGEDGTLRAVTVLERYRQIDGIWVPTYLEVHYPERETRMVMRLSGIAVNTQLNPRLFVFPKNNLFCPKIISKVTNCVKFIQNNLSEVSGKDMDSIVFNMFRKRKKFFSFTKKY